jgi:general stress protein 26
MTKTKIMEIIQALIDDSKTAVLTTVDPSGVPTTRWVTPGCVKERYGALYLVSEIHLSKVKHIKENPLASMMFQTRSLDRILSVKGRVNIISNPSILTETLECVGHNLHSFWKIETEHRELVVLEFIIEEAKYYLPLTGSVEIVSFTSEG